jgi:hypothetical protein
MIKQFTGWEYPVISPLTDYTGSPEEEGKLCEYLLCYSKDTLITLDAKWQPIEWICDGIDNDAFVAGTNDLNDYLEAINTIKGMIRNGINPKVHLITH